MTPQELKNSILQLAIQGKLVEQRAEEGTGKELLEKILAAKNAEIAKGKGEKSHAKSAKSAKVGSRVLHEEIPDDEKPFDIPESWEWVRLGEVGSLTRGSGIKRTETRESGYPCIRYGELYTTYKIRFSITKSFVDEPLYDNSKKISNGDIVMTLTGENKTDIATAVVYEGQDEIAMGGDMTCWSHHGMESLYLVYLMNSPYAIGCKRKLATGDIIVHISNEKLSSILLPLPPLAEQKRIVAKIEELLPLVERYEKAWSKLKDFNKRFPVDMQKSLLQMAIQGKLVDQRPEEGTGEELYRQIQAEKQRLIKSGKIKKEKPLPAITEAEIPFDIPDSWKWVRLQNIVSVLGDGIHGTPVFDEAGEYYFVNGNNLVNGSIVVKVDTKKVSAGEYDKYKKPLDENSILISINGTIGNYAFYAGEPIILGKSACYFSVLIGVDKKYILHLLNTKFFTDYAVKEATQTTIKNVSLKAMRMFPIPLPPLAEQKRIVAKLEELLPLCERLKR